MRIKTLLIIGLLLSSKLFTQDLFIYKDGSELSVKVLKINKYDINYKKTSNINGPEYTEEKSNLFMIKYANGSKDMFAKESDNNNNNNNKENSELDRGNNSCEHEKDTILFLNNKYMVVCQSCNQKIRFATAKEVSSNVSSSQNKKNMPGLPCGEKPIPPPKFNNPQYKQTPAYKKYRKELNIWKDCLSE